MSERRFHRTLTPDGMRFGTYAARSAELAPASAREVVQVLHVEADSPNVIFGAYRLETVFFPTGTIKVAPYGSLRAPYEIPEDSTYSVVSRVPNAPPEQLRSAGDDYPKRWPRSTQPCRQPASVAPVPSPAG